MSQAAYVTWMIERNVSKGRLRIGVLAGRVVVELGDKRLALPNTDIIPLAEVAASRATAHLARALRDGGYVHLLGGQVALLPGEATVLREAALGTPEGLRLRRAKLVEALAQKSTAPAVEGGAATGLIHHTDGLDADISEARLALSAFDHAHPQVLAALVARRQNGSTKTP